MTRTYQSKSASEEATGARGASPDALRLFLLVFITIVIVAIVMFLTGVIAFVGDAQQAGEVGEPIPGHSTSETRP